MQADDVRRRRETLGASPQELAAALGVLTSHVQAWESGDQPITPTDARLIEQGFQGLELSQTREREARQAWANVRIRTPEEMAQLRAEADRTKHLRVMEEPPSVAGWLGVYFGFLLLGLLLAILGERLYGIAGERSIFAYCGVIFLLAAAGRPVAVYRVLRWTRWFAAIRDARTMRLLMLGLGLLLLLAAVLWPQPAYKPLHVDEGPGMFSGSPLILAQRPLASERLGR